MTGSAFSTRASTPLLDDSTTQAAKLSERSVALIALAGVTLLAWGYTIHLASAMHSGAMVSMATDVVLAWGLRDIAFTLVMWAVMMFAMMLPSAGPMVLTFAATAGEPRTKSFTGLFISGYLVIWTLFSVGATLLQWLMHSLGLLGPDAQVLTPKLGAALLILAGLYQFSPLKYACLSTCRSPANFLVTEWRNGARGAFVMGLRHGMYCVGCCWMLMLLLFVAGVMNLLWVAGIAAVVFVEKTLPSQAPFFRVVGIAAIVGGLGLLLKSMI